jgi:hypothetical protein
MTIQKQEKVDYSYLAGLIDGDGLILAQIVKREEYRYKYEIRVSVTLNQKTKRHWFLEEVQLEIGGNLRKRNDGMSELTVLGRVPIENLLKELLPYLRIKKATAKIALEILKEESEVKTRGEFIEVCKKVDKIADYTDSKKRKITSEVVEGHMKETPVETRQ